MPPWSAEEDYRMYRSPEPESPSFEFKVVGHRLEGIQRLYLGLLAS